MSDDKPVTPMPAPLPVLRKFGPEAVDRAINRQLQESIPGDARTAVFDVTLVNAEGARLITGVVAGNLGNGWGIALGGEIDLDDRDDYEVGVHVRKAW